MKKVLLMLFITLLCATIYAQGGLECIIVEQVDTNFGPDDGLVSHRVYIDLEPGYELQQVFGDADNPLHISTTTSWHNIWYGALSGDSINSLFINPPIDTPDPLLPFDSYISLGAAASAEWGVRLIDDVDNWTNGRAFLDPVNAVVIVGDINVAENFGANASSSSIVANSELGGRYLTLTSNADVAPGNRIYIGQFTTDGDLSFSINIRTALAGSTDFFDLYASDVPMLNYSPANNNDCDFDGVLNAEDNCPSTANAAQADLDEDTVGDVCDDDIDGDGFLNSDDCDAFDPVLFFGAICDDGDECTTDDAINAECVCVGSPNPESNCPTDFNDDDKTDGEDFSIFLGNFQNTCNDVACGCQTDLNNDGTTDGDDFAIFLGNFGLDCPF